MESCRPREHNSIQLHVLVFNFRTCLTLDQVINIYLIQFISVSSHGSHLFIYSCMNVINECRKQLGLLHLCMEFSYNCSNIILLLWDSQYIFSSVELSVVCECPVNSRLHKCKMSWNLIKSFILYKYSIVKLCKTLYVYNWFVG